MFDGDRQDIVITADDKRAAVVADLKLLPSSASPYLFPRKLDEQLVAQLGFDGCHSISEEMRERELAARFRERPATRFADFAMPMCSAQIENMIPMRMGAEMLIQAQ